MFIPASVIKYPVIKSVRGRRKGFILAPICRLQSIRAGKSRLQTQPLTSHPQSRTERMFCIQLDFPTLHSSGPSLPREWCHPCPGGWMFPRQLLQLPTDKSTDQPNGDNPSLINSSGVILCHIKSITKAKPPHFPAPP